MRIPHSSIFAAARSALVLVGASFLALPAASQAQSEPELEEIIVTAQKRTQTLAEVPLSITVLSGDMLERQQASRARGGDAFGGFATVGWAGLLKTTGARRVSGGPSRRCGSGRTRP